MRPFLLVFYTQNFLMVKILTLNYKKTVNNADEKQVDKNFSNNALAWSLFNVNEKFRDYCFYLNSSTNKENRILDIGRVEFCQ